MIKLYGIPNCATVKKARLWLDEHHVAFEFVDFKKNAPTVEQIDAWLAQVGVEVLLNKRGTTWRKLDDATKNEAASPSGAVRVMAEYPSAIKRPVLEKDGSVYVGFSEEEYARIFA